MELKKNFTSFYLVLPRFTSFYLVLPRKHTPFVEWLLHSALWIAVAIQIYWQTDFSWYWPPAIDDWLTSKTIKPIEEQKAVRQHRQQQNILEQLEKQFETLKQQYQNAQTSVIDRLIADEIRFQTAYDGVMNQFDTASLFTRRVCQFSTPQAAYQDYTALRSLMNVYIEQHFLTEFDDFEGFCKRNSGS